MCNVLVGITNIISQRCVACVDDGDDAFLLGAPQPFDRDHRRRVLLRRRSATYYTRPTEHTRTYAVHIPARSIGPARRASTMYDTSARPMFRSRDARAIYRGGRNSVYADKVNAHVICESVSACAPSTSVGG